MMKLVDEQLEEFMANKIFVFIGPGGMQKFKLAKNNIINVLDGWITEYDKLFKAGHFTQKFNLYEVQEFKIHKEFFFDKQEELYKTVIKFKMLDIWYRFPISFKIEA